MPGAEDALPIIKKFTADHGYPPTVRELAPLLGVSSTATVFRWLSQLRAAGKVSWIDNFPRTLRVIDGAEHDGDVRSE
jgi:repressor LexA